MNLRTKSETFRDCNENALFLKYSGVAGTARRFVAGTRFAVSPANPGRRGDGRLAARAGRQRRKEPSPDAKRSGGGKRLCFALRRPGDAGVRQRCRTGPRFATIPLGRRHGNRGKTSNNPANRYANDLHAPWRFPASASAFRKEFFKTNPARRTRHEEPKRRTTFPFSALALPRRLFRFSDFAGR